MPDLVSRLAALPLWSGPIEIEPLTGGMTNRNLLIRSPQGKFVARIAGNNAVHDIDRGAEQAATRAAASAGLGPALVWAEADMMILRHIEGHALEARDLLDDAALGKVVVLLRQTREVMPSLYDGPARDRRPIALLRHYTNELLAKPNRWHGAVNALMPRVVELDARLAAIPRGFAHNDLHGGNLIDDGKRLWLVDWEYAGHGQAMADAASLANNAMLSDEQAEAMLALWLAREPTGGDRADFAAMRLAAALRDLFWGYAQDAFLEADASVLAGYIGTNEGRVAAAAARVQLSCAALPKR